jgi:hypothetical protein
MKKIILWTGTQNKIDMENESIFVEKQGVFELHKERIDNNNSKDLDLSKFRVTSQFEVDPNFITVAIPNAIKLAKESLSTSLQHVMLKCTDGVLKVIAARDCLGSAYTFKANCKEDFEVCLSIRDLEALSQFQNCLSSVPERHSLCNTGT